MDGDTQVTVAGSPRAARAARDLLPVTAAAGAAALFVTIVVGGTTSELHTASLADRAPSVVDPSARPAIGGAGDVTVRVTPRSPRSGDASSTELSALPADAGALFDLTPVPVPAGRGVAVASAPAGLRRLSFPFSPSTATAVPAAPAPAELPVVPAEVPAGEVTPVPEAPLAPGRGSSPKTGKTKTTDSPTRTTSSSTTTTVSLQWSSVSGSTDGGDEADSKDKDKGKAYGRMEDPPPDHSQADEHSKAHRS